LEATRLIEAMLAMQLPAAGQKLMAVDRPTPAPISHEVPLKVRACGVCRTDLHIVDGELPPVRTPLIPGHEIALGALRDGAFNGAAVLVPAQ